MIGRRVPEYTSSYKNSVKYFKTSLNLSVQTTFTLGPHGKLVVRWCDQHWKYQLFHTIYLQFAVGIEMQYETKQF